MALRAFKNLAVEGRIVFDEARRLPRTAPPLTAGRHPFMRLATIFTERAAGNRRLKVAAPVDADFSGLPPLPDRDNAFHLTRAAEQSGELGLIGEEWARWSAHPAETRHTVDPDRDTNGAGLLYFANYAVLINIAEREALNGAGRDRAAAPPRLLRQRRTERSAAHHGGRVRPERSERHRGRPLPRSPRRGRSADLPVGSDPAAEDDSVTGARVVRQAVVALLCLAALDRLIPGWLASAEARRYESEVARRFAQSDVFALGPLVSYLREHPRGPRPRIAFLGDSIVWGYGVAAEDTVAARFQARAPEEHVLNLGMNNTDTGDMYLIAKSVLDSVATLYVFDRLPRVLHPQLPQLIPVAPGRPDAIRTDASRTRERQRRPLVLASVP